MDLKGFKESLDRNTPPKDIGHALQALWHQANGEWGTAHQLAQSQDDVNGAWVYAFLHRVKGDNTNADYWYRRAGKPISSELLNEEWEEIVSALLLD